MQILNISGYCFISLIESTLSDLQQQLLSHCSSLNLKGTILLSLEGININLAGFPADIQSFKNYFQNDPRFAGITFRESYSDQPPFKQMKVRLRKEIITMRQPDVRPDRVTAPTLSPLDLKRWLDEKRELTLLDTRNDYEVQFGTFSAATHLNISDFCEFPRAIAQIERNKPIVMFCTGGIRCEKAALCLINAGFTDVYQLQGGILNYFAEVGGAHYEGECFVFDERIAVDTSLHVTGTQQCVVCQGPIKSLKGCSACEQRISLSQQETTHPCYSAKAEIHTE